MRRPSKARYACGLRNCVGQNPPMKTDVASLGAFSGGTGGQADYPPGEHRPLRGLREHPGQGNAIGERVPWLGVERVRRIDRADEGAPGDPENRLTGPIGPGSMIQVTVGYVHDGEPSNLMSAMQRLGQRNQPQSALVLVLISLLLTGGDYCLGGER